MTYTATARPIDGALRHEIDVNGRHTITTDEPAKLGGTDTAPTPHELLAATLASCVSTMIMLYARRHAWDLDGTQVDVEYDADTAPRRVVVTLRLPDGLSAEQIKRLQRVAETCPVRRSLEAGFTFDERLAAVLPGAGADRLHILSLRLNEDLGVPPVARCRRAALDRERSAPC